MNPPETCDLVIIGGGVTGAGLFHETTRLGLNVVLAEQNDFAWGTSSRSSKLIHGGLRYLKEGHFLLTRDAVKERERLLQEAPGLVEPVTFLVPLYKDRGPGRWTMEAGLSVYDFMAQKRQHVFLTPEAVIGRLPFIERKSLLGGYEFGDAQVDDARLVLRLIAEGERAGGLALNYTIAASVNRNDQGRVCAVTMRDVEDGRTWIVNTPAVINATGCWAERLHPQLNAKRHLRPLRGSHLFFPGRVLPVRQAISFIHPRDQRAIFIIPWQGVVLVGTTDLDHSQELEVEPAMTREEADYLLEGIRNLFPSLDLSLDHCIASIAGLRPVISSGGNRAPSEESREHDIWVDQGLVTIAGGKLTTYRRVALDALKAAQPFLPPLERPSPESPGFLASKPPPAADGIDPDAWLRLWGRYGPGAHTIVGQAGPEDRQPIPGTPTLWAELPYAAAHEQVRHLSDLLLRRVRIGLLLPDGGRANLRRIKRLCRPVLNWNRRRWRREVKLYLNLWKKTYGFPWRTRDAGPLKSLWHRFGFKV